MTRALSCAAVCSILVIACASAPTPTLRYERAFKALERKSEYCNGKPVWEPAPNGAGPREALAEARDKCIATLSKLPDRTDFNQKVDQALRCMQDAGWSLGSTGTGICLSGGP